MQIQDQSCKYKSEPANTSPAVQVQSQTHKCKARHANTMPYLQIQGKSCKYKPRRGNTSPVVQIQSQKPTNPNHRLANKWKPRAANASQDHPRPQAQAQPCTYKPKPTIQSPDLRIQSQTCKYKPGIAQSYPELRIQAETCKYKPRAATGPARTKPTSMSEMSCHCPPGQNQSSPDLQT